MHHGPFRKGRISRRLPEFWQRSVVPPDRRITATNIKKWIVTECHEKKHRGENVNEQVLRESMCHSDTTAKTFYLRQELTEVAAQAVAIIVKCTQDCTIKSPIQQNRPGQTRNGWREGCDIHGFQCAHPVQHDLETEIPNSVKSFFPFNLPYVINQCHAQERVD